MTNQDVINAIRRRMNGIEHELLADPPVTSEQFAACVAEYALEQMRTFLPKEPEAAPAAPPEPHAAGAKEAHDALDRLGKALDSLPKPTASAAAPPPASAHEPAPAAASGGSPRR